MRDLDFDAMHLFARVAELGTLTAVARERDVPVSLISRTLTRIERASGTRLIHRSTHGLSLTAEGEIFLGYCRRLTGTLDELEGEFADQSGEANGQVRVAVSSVIAQFQMVPSLPGLAALHPRLKVQLEVDDRITDMARDGIDIAIRSGNTMPESAVARRIGSHGRALYAAPAYIAERGAPAGPEDLHTHSLVTNSAVASLNRWPFRVGGEAKVVLAEGDWRCNDTNVAASMVLQGLGIGRLATLVGEPLVAEGRLVRVLEQWVDAQPVPIFGVTLGGRHRLPKIRACLDWWAAWFGRIAVPVAP
jgi:DNA-binding transcriptional LysR family regulator